jgi:hypothetical protein
MQERVQNLLNLVTTEFKKRTVTDSKRSGIDYGITLDAGVDSQNIFWMTFSKEKEAHSVTFPVPFIENGVTLIRQNEVLRALCPFWIEEEQRQMDYLEVIFDIIFDIPDKIVPKHLVKMTPYLQQMIYSFNHKNASIVAYRFQKAINEIIHMMPLHETYMNSHIMNNRLIIIDPEFEDLKSPEQQLIYQKNKAIKYFDRGWTSIGLSDQSLANKNYILQKDIRRLSPFGIRYHNPQRNLYSTLGMKGDELPIIRSQSMQNLMDLGICRKGWNLLTAFVDIPDVFEDQIMVDISHRDKFITYTRRLQVFGKVTLKEGSLVKTGDVVGISEDGKEVKFKPFCDSAKVSKISSSYVSVGGTSTKVFNLVIEYRRFFRDGLKFTNLHGNKGIIRMANLGVAKDPRTGELRKIDVIVGAKTVGKRKNFGQILEATTNCILEVDKPNCDHVVIPDDWSQPIEEIKAGLAKRGFREDATWDCDTYAGKVKAVCGKVFWGCIKTAEDQIWQKNATISRNGRDIRTAGLKLSHVEFAALETAFGEGNAVLDEAMSYIQGTANLREQLIMLESKIGRLPVGKPLHTLSTTKPLDQSLGTIVPKECIAGTVVDENFCPDGFVFQLPYAYQVLLDKDRKVVHEGFSGIYEQMTSEKKLQIKEVYNLNALYFPSSTLRRCWRHGTGKYGLSEIGVAINNVVSMAHRTVAEPNNSTLIRFYFNAISTYFSTVATRLCGKKGEIANLSMSVRLPFSVKAVAALSTTLPKNTVEIHRSMAEALRVNNGDIVLAERFPCLGFMSIRPQKVRITDDPMCKYVIRASGFSLVSTNLDFDGDVIYLAAFHTAAAKKVLEREWANPNPSCYKEIDRLNRRKGAPHVKEYNLHDFNINPYSDLTCSEHANIVEKNTGVKAQTGPVIALTYNVMRILENSDIANDRKSKVATQMFLEKAAQSVFEQKHGGRSLYSIVMEGVCTANVEMLVEVGFQRGITEKICNTIKTRAAGLGIFDLVRYRQYGNIISKIVRCQNRIYFVSRSGLEGVSILNCLEEPPVDVPSRMFKWVLSGRPENFDPIKSILGEQMAMRGIKKDKFRDACKDLCELTESICSSTSDYGSFVDNVKRNPGWQ